MLCYPVLSNPKWGSRLKSWTSNMPLKMWEPSKTPPLPKHLGVRCDGAFLSSLSITFAALQSVFAYISHAPWCLLCSEKFCSAFASCVRGDWLHPPTWCQRAHLSFYSFSLSGFRGRFFVNLYECRGSNITCRQRLPTHKQTMRCRTIWQDLTSCTQTHTRIQISIWM